MRPSGLADRLGVTVRDRAFLQLPNLWFEKLRQSEDKGFFGDAKHTSTGDLKIKKRRSGVGMAKSHGYQVGVEAKIQYHPVLDVLGSRYESWRRKALNWLQSGLTESEVEKRLQREFNIDWAWADSIATEATQCLEQQNSL